MILSDVLFPTSYSDIPRAELLHAFAAGPDRVRRTLRGLQENQLRERSVNDAWSIQEIVCHLADAELIAAVRLRLVLAHDVPVMPTLDPNRCTAVLKYHSWEPVQIENALNAFTVVRLANVHLLEGVGEDAWGRVGIDQKYGQVTLRNLLELAADHSERHVAQIIQRRDLMGVHLNLPPLLPRRLY